MDKLIIIIVLSSAIVTFVNPLPIKIKNENNPTPVLESLPEIKEKLSVIEPVEKSQTVVDTNNSDRTISTNSNSRNLEPNTVRPGVTVTEYVVNLHPDIEEGTFSGEVTITVSVTEATLAIPFRFQLRELEVNSVTYAIGGSSNFVEVPSVVNEDTGIITIEPELSGSTLRFKIEYEGELNPANGFYAGADGNENTYLAMNLHPTYARYVFPCIDEPTEASVVTLSVEGLEYNLFSNARLEDDSTTTFRPLTSSSHRLGLMAHNYPAIDLPGTNVRLYGRQVGNDQTAMALVTISSVFSFLNEWTNKNYFEIVEGIQSTHLQITVIPDLSSTWNSLSVIGIWEPYVYMQPQHSMLQRVTGMVHIAEAISRQWFGFVLWPDNWIHEWVISGLGTYAAYQALEELETNPNDEEDDSLLDMNAIFVTDVVRESLLQDSAASVLVMQPANRIFNEDIIRGHMNSVLRVKAPAIINMLKHVLGGESNLIESASRGLFVSRSLQTVSFLNFVDAINGELIGTPDGIIGNVGEFLAPYVSNSGPPLITIGLSPDGVTVTLGRFGFTPRPAIAIRVPITYTTSNEPDFEDLTPTEMIQENQLIGISGIDDDTWVIFNIQGQGYYRVNYVGDLWDRLIGALEDPEERENIHPLNRATLVDDALNLARAGTITYDVAFSVMMAAMEQETEYAVWKVYIRNMNFIKKNLMSAVADDGDLDPEIYTRLIRRVIVAFEEELTFEPTLAEPAMVSLTRGLVMDHVCRADYEHCVAAAVDIFYADNDEEPTVNPAIPLDVRPAVYCTMAREGDEEAIEALQNRLEVELTMYERIVILESLACSQDTEFINGYLAETIAADSPYSIEEKFKIFAAVAESSLENAHHALRFMIQNTNAIREQYGGPEKLEAALFVLVDNMIDGASVEAYQNWVGSINNNLEESHAVAMRAASIIQENQAWRDNHLDDVYEWIEENDATAAVVSTFLVFLTFMLTIFNN